MLTSPDARELVYKTRYGDGEDLTTAIVFAVAAAKGIDPVDVDENLYDVVDVSAIETLFRGSDYRGRGERSSIGFAFANRHVVVRSDNVIQIYE